MILRANPFIGYLDISAPELLGADLTWNFRRTVVSGETFHVPDEYYRFPNIKNAINAGMLTILAYDSNPDSLVINAELAGYGVPVAGTKYVLLDFHGAADTEMIKIVNGVPYLIFSHSVEDSSRWTLTLPEDYIVGTNVYVEAYWSPSKTTGGNVQWALGYASDPPGTPIGPMTMSTYVQAAPIVPNVLSTTGNSLVIPPAALAVSNLLTVALFRQGKAPTDTFAGQAWVHLVRIAYTGKKFAS